MGAEAARSDTWARHSAELAERYLRSSGTAGIAVGIFDRGVTCCFGYGAGRAGEGPPDGDTLFEIGSITKVFTTLLLAELVGRGVVSLDDRIGRFALVPEPAKASPITLLHLATHTSGLPRLPPNLHSEKLDPGNPYAHYTLAELAACLARHPPRRAAGCAKGYSNYGAGLLGALLAEAAGTDYETLVRERIAGPLGLSDTGIRLSPEQQARLAPGHSRGKEVPNWDLAALAGAGALRSSTRDLLRFLAANLGHDAGSLRPALALTHQLQFGRLFALSTPYRLGRFALSLAPVAALYFLTRGSLGWLPRVLLLIAAGSLIERCLGRWVDARLEPVALGWHLDRVRSLREPVLWHNGGTGGYRSYLAFSPEGQVGVVVLANSTDVGVEEIGRTLLARAAARKP